MGQLAAKIRAKYPGAYDDLDDAALEERVLAKHPEYQDLAGPSRPQAPQPGLLERGVNAVGNFVTGAVKEAPLVAMRAANLPLDVASGAMSLLTDQMGPEAQAADIRRNEQNFNVRQAVEAPLQPKPDEGRAGSLGRIAARTTPNVVLAALTGGASLPAQAAIQAASSGAQTVSEGGGAGDAAVSASLGAVSPSVGPLLSRVVGAPAKGLKTLAVKQYQRALGATKDATKAEAARIAPELVERGVTGSLKSLSQKATTQVDDLGKQIQAEYRAATSSGTKIDGNQIASGLDRLRKPFVEIGQSGDEVILNPKAIGAIEDLQGVLRELGDTTPSAIWKFRKTVDDIVSESNGFTRELPGGTARALQKQVRGILQEELNKTVPNVQKLNSEFRLWKGLQDVANATIKRQTSQERNLIPAIMGSGVFGGAAATGTMTGALPAGVAAAMLTQLVRSPLWRTTSAVTKNALADVLSGSAQALRTTNGRNAMMLLSLIGGKASTDSAPTATPQEIPGQ